MSDLVAFLAVRLAEDEAVVNGLAFACQIPDRVPDFTFTGGPAAERFWGHFGPAYMLREVEAKRAILALHDVHSEPERWGDSHSDRAMRGQPTGHTVYWCDECDHDRDYEYIASREEGCPTLRILAAIYSDHPDYRDEWKS